MDYENLSIKSGIYLIQNILTQSIYIGQAQNIRYRCRKHREALLKNKHRNSKLQNSVNKYGISAFEFYVVEECLIEDLDTHEQEWLDLVRLEYPLEHIYNLCFEPNTTRGYKFTKEQRVAQSERLRNKVIGDSARKNYGISSKLKWQQGKMKPKIKKEFDIITPEGNLIHVIGLSDFAAQHNLSAGSLHMVITGKLKQYKGYTIPK